MLLLIEKNVQKKIWSAWWKHNSRRQCVGENNQCKYSTAGTRIVQIDLSGFDPLSRKQRVVRSTFNYLIIIYRDRQLINESNKRFPLKRAFSVRKSRTVVLCIKMLRIRVQSSDEWKAIPPTRDAIENRAGSEISIIASGYYIHRAPPFSMSCSLQHRRFHDIAISCRWYEPENDLSITGNE